MPERAECQSVAKGLPFKAENAVRELEMVDLMPNHATPYEPRMPSTDANRMTKAYGPPCYVAEVRNIRPWWRRSTPRGWRAVCLA